jgi:hypothetical protein
MTTRRWTIVVAQMACILGFTVWCGRLPGDEQTIVILLLSAGALWVLVRILITIP